VCQRGDPEKEGNHRVKRESAMWQFSAVSARLVAEQRPSEKAHWVPSRPRARTCGSAASDGDGRKEERVRFIGLRSSRGIPVVFLGYSSRRTQEARDLLSEPTLMGTCWLSTFHIRSLGHQQLHSHAKLRRVHSDCMRRALTRKLQKYFYVIFTCSIIHENFPGGQGQVVTSK
jgi:hypothetical protein